MEFEPIDFESAQKIGYYYGGSQTMVFLTNGEEYIGKCEGIEFSMVYGSESFSEPHFNLSLEKHNIYIPLSKMAGAWPASVIEGSGPYEIEYTEHHPPLIDQWYEDTYNKAVENGLPIDSQPDRGVETLYSIRVPYDWSVGEIHFGRDQPIYADWDEISRRKGGLSSLGAGVPFGSASVGWDESLWSTFNKEISGKTTSLDNLKDVDKNSVVISGYITFIEGEEKDTDTSEYIQMMEEGALAEFNRGRIEKSKWENSIMVEKLDEAEWYASVVTSEPIIGEESLMDQDWMLTFWKTDGDLVSSFLWEHFTQPIRISCSISINPIRTPFGRSEIILKARAAGYLTPSKGVKKWLRIT